MNGDQVGPVNTGAPQTPPQPSPIPPAPMQPMQPVQPAPQQPLPQQAPQFQQLPPAPAAAPLGFLDAVKLAFSRYTDFGGRSGLREFWWFTLFSFLVMTVIMALFNGIELTPGLKLGTMLGLLYSLVTLLPSVAVGVRRLRDAGHHWANYFWGLVPFIGVLILIYLWTRPTKPGIV